MRDQTDFSVGRRWIYWSSFAMAVVIAASAWVGLIWIPSGQSIGPQLGFWDAICRAAGRLETTRPPLLQTVPQSSDVVVTPFMMKPANLLSIGHGGTLAMQCSMCHGIQGAGLANVPNLAGQPESMIYKQLRDFKAGHRHNAIMQAVASQLDDQAMRDLAAFYGSLARDREVATAVVSMPTIVSNGAPMRGIAACSACHAVPLRKAAIPLLGGQPISYLESQLTAFSRGDRANDINRAMRNVASHLSPTEIASAAKFYAGQ